MELKVDKNPIGAIILLKIWYYFKRTGKYSMEVQYFDYWANFEHFVRNISKSWQKNRRALPILINLVDF